MEFLFAWYNLVFLISLVTGVIFIFGSMLGMDADADVDADADAGVGHDHDQDHDSSHGGFFASVFSAIGVGRVPLSLVMTFMFMFFGTIGMIMNRLLVSFIEINEMFALVSVGIAVLGSVLFSGRLARVMHKYMPTVETNVVSISQLVGQSGTVSLALNSKKGLANVRDRSGTLHEATFELDEGEAVAGMKVLLVSYDRESSVFKATEFNLD